MCVRVRRAELCQKSLFRGECPDLHCVERDVRAPSQWKCKRRIPPCFGKLGSPLERDRLLSMMVWRSCWRAKAVANASVGAGYQNLERSCGEFLDPVVGRSASATRNRRRVDVVAGEIAGGPSSGQKRR